MKRKIKNLTAEQYQIDLRIAYPGLIIPALFLIDDIPTDQSILFI